MMAADRSPLVAVLDGKGKDARAARRGQHLRPARRRPSRADVRLTAACRRRRLSFPRAPRCRRPADPHRAGPAGAQDRPGARRDLPRREVRARLRQPLRAARRHRAERADHRQAGQRGAARPCSRPTPTRPRWRPPTGRPSRAIIGPLGLLPRQDRVAAQAQRGPGREVRRRGAAPAQGPGRAARRRPQDRQRGARQRLRHPRDHRGHPLRPAGPPVRLDRGDRPGQGRARRRRRCSPSATGRCSATT